MKSQERIAKALTRAASLAFLLAPAACAPADLEAEAAGFDSYADGGVVDELDDKAALSNVYEAEARTATNGCTVATNWSGYNGTGFMDFGGNGTWIEWNNVNVPTDGTRKVSFRYANASSSARQAAIYVNGGSPVNVPFSSTGSWTNWTTVEVSLALRAGNNTIRVLANTSAGGPNLDSMELPGISVVGTSSVYDFNGQDLKVVRPKGVTNGDLMVLILHRTDDSLPVNVDGWTSAAQCYKRDNGYQCATAKDCTSWSSNRKFCNSFGSTYGAGQDLAQSIFYKTASNEPESYEFDLNQDSSGHPGWAILTALRGAANTDPVRAWSHKGCDGSANSVFPSVLGDVGDFLLLSQSFDDNVSQSTFLPPNGTSLLGFINGDGGPAPDETGYLFGRRITVKGDTGTMTTNGNGASSCKDALISLTIKPR